MERNSLEYSIEHRGPARFGWFGTHIRLFRRICVPNQPKNAPGPYGSRGGTLGSGTSGKSQVAIDFLRNTGTDPPWEAMGYPLGPIALREVRPALCEICWWLKKMSGPPWRNFLHPSMRYTISGFHTKSDCWSRGCGFDPSPAPHFRGDWSWNIFYGHSPPSPDSSRAVDS